MIAKLPSKPIPLPSCPLLHLSLLHLLIFRGCPSSQELNRKKWKGGTMTDNINLENNFLLHSQLPKLKISPSLWLHALLVAYKWSKNSFPCISTNTRNSKLPWMLFFSVAVILSGQIHFFLLLWRQRDLLAGPFPTEWSNTNPDKSCNFQAFCQFWASCQWSNPKSFLLKISHSLS